jgi:hypothetical protein
MNRQTFEASARAAMSDETVLPVEIDIQSAWFLVSGLQLAIRHPDISDEQRAVLVSIGRTFQGAIEALHPEAHEALELGWRG